MKWIRFDQELPPFNTPILIYMDGTYHIAKLTDGKEIIINSYPITIRYTLKSGFTHWALIDEPNL